MIRQEICDLPCALKAISMQATVMAGCHRENVYMLKIGAKSFGDGNQDIC